MTGDDAHSSRGLISKQTAWEGSLLPERAAQPKATAAGMPWNSPYLSKALASR